MKTYILDFVNNEVETIEKDEKFNSHDGMFFELPNNTQIFLTRRFFKAMNENLEDMETVYEGESVADKFPPLEDE